MTAPRGPLSGRTKVSSAIQSNDAADRGLKRSMAASAVSRSFLRRYLSAIEAVAVLLLLLLLLLPLPPTVGNDTGGGIGISSWMMRRTLVAPSRMRRYLRSPTAPSPHAAAAAGSDDQDWFLGLVRFFFFFGFFFQKSNKGKIKRGRH